MVYSLRATFQISKKFKLPKMLRDVREHFFHDSINNWWIEEGVLIIQWIDGSKTRIEGEVDSDDEDKNVIEDFEVCNTDDENENSDDDEDELQALLCIPTKDLPEEVRKARQAYYDIHRKIAAKYKDTNE